MDSSKGLLLQSLGLCLILYYVNAATSVRFVRNNLFNPNEDMSGKLSDLKDRQADLERELEKRKCRVERFGYEMELRSIKDSISYLEETLKVPYKDYVQSTAEQRQEFEREKAEQRQEFEWEKAELWKRLEIAEDMWIKVNTELTEQRKEKGDQIGYYERILDELTEQRNKIANEYAQYIDAFYRQEQNMKLERERFLAEQEKLQQTLDEAKREHARTLDQAKKEHAQTLDQAKKKHEQALETISAMPAESYRPYVIPEQKEINKLRADITVFSGLKDRKQLNEGLERTKKNLEELLGKLHRFGKFSTQASHDDLKSELCKLEKNVILQREEQDNRRKGLVEKMKQKDLTNSIDEELSSLRRANKEISALSGFQKEIDRRSAYLTGIWEVYYLLKECSDAIRDANERKTANMSLAKLFTKKDRSGSKTISNQPTMAIEVKQDGRTMKTRKDDNKKQKSNPFSIFTKKPGKDAKTTLGTAK